MAVASSTTVTVAGFDVATREIGAGPTLLFLHGGGVQRPVAGDTPPPSSPRSPIVRVWCPNIRGSAPRAAGLAR